MADNKKVTTVRLEEHTHEQLRRAAYHLGHTQSRIIEDALSDYFQAHNLDNGYQLTFTDTSIVLLQQRQDRPPKVLEVHKRNGVPPQEVASKYRTKLGEPVRVIVQKGE